MLTESCADPNDGFAFDPFPLDCWIVDERLASKAARASGERVCENERGGKGTLPGVGGTKAGYEYDDEFELEAVLSVGGNE